MSKYNSYMSDVVSLRLDKEVRFACEATITEIGKKAWLFAKLQPGRGRKRINAT